MLSQLDNRGGQASAVEPSKQPEEKGWSDPSEEQVANARWRIVSRLRRCHLWSDRISSSAGEQVVRSGIGRRASLGSGRSRSSRCALPTRSHVDAWRRCPDHRRSVIAVLKLRLSVVSRSWIG